MIWTSKLDRGYIRRLINIYNQATQLPWWVQCIVLWAFVLITLTITGLVSVRAVDIREGYDPRFGIPQHSIPGVWVRWDSNYYLSIARNGYAGFPNHYGFFPLYPILIAATTKLVGTDISISGILISQLSYLGAILLFYKLARRIYDNHPYGMRVIISMLLFPTSFFFLALYAESIYVLLAILSVYLIFVSPPRWFRSGLVVGLASVSRPIGWLLNINLGIEFLSKWKQNRSSIIFFITGVVISISGVVIYILYLFNLTGSFTAIPEAQAHWGRHWQYPWITLYKSILISLTGNRVPGDWFLYTINWIDLTFTLVALSACFYAIKLSLRGNFPWSLTSYMVVFLLFTLSSEGPYLTGSDGLDVIPLWGMSRWVAQLFPIYLLLGTMDIAPWLRRVLSFTSFGLLIIFTAWWTSGRWVG